MSDDETHNHALRFRRFQQSREKFFAPLINSALHKQYLTAAHYAPTMGSACVQKIDSARIALVIKHLYLDAGIVYGAKIRADFAKMGVYKQANNYFKSYKFNPYHVQSGEHGGEFTTGPEPTEEEIAVAVATYQSTLFDAINNELRYDKPDKYKDVIKLLDKASVDETSDTLYRGLDSNFAKTLAQKHNITDLNNLDELKSKLIGKTIHDKGFMSTTRNLQSANDFARDLGTGKTTVMQIGGTKKGIEVTKYVDNYRARIEKEFIIKRGSTVKITNVSLSKTGKLILYTEAQKQQKELKRAAMGFSERMHQLITDYFRLDILNVSEGITQTTRELITQVFTDAYASGYSINEIVKQLQNTELSKIRARLIARTETVTAANKGAMFVAKDTGLLLNKTWLATKDKRTRDDHREIDGQQVGRDDYFHVGGYEMAHPGDRGGHDGKLPVPAKEICNCRCTHTFSAVRDSNGRLIRA